MPREAQIDKVRLLAGIPLFRCLEQRDLETLAAHARLRRYGPHEVIFRQGDPGNYLLVVVGGVVEARTMGPLGQERIIDLFGPGEVVGEIAFLDGAERSADAIAFSGCACLVVDRRDFMPLLLLDRPEVGERLMVLLCARIRRTTQLLEEAIEHGPARVARALVRLATKFGEPVPEGVRIALRLTQRELGWFTGLTRESVNHLLKLLRDEGLIRIEKGWIVVTDLDGLRHF